MPTTTTKRLLRIDFVAANACCAKPGCGRPLKRGYIVLEDGIEKAYGPECIQSFFSKEEVRQAPDLTRRERQTTQGKRAGSAGLHPPIAGDDGDDFETQRRRASEYLFLRVDCMVRVCGVTDPGIPWEPLVPLLDRLRQGQSLTPEDIQRVMKTENHAPEKFRLINLLDVYAAYAQIERKRRGAKKKNSIEFWQSLQRHLRSELFLHPGQITRAGIVLPEGAFAWHSKQKARDAEGRKNSTAI